MPGCMAGRSAEGAIYTWFLSGDLLVVRRNIARKCFIKFFLFQFTEKNFVACDTGQPETGGVSLLLQAAATMELYQDRVEPGTFQ